MGAPFPHPSSIVLGCRGGSVPQPQDGVMVERGEPGAQSLVWSLVCGAAAVGLSSPPPVPDALPGMQFVPAAWGGGGGEVSFQISLMLPERGCSININNTWPCQHSELQGSGADPAAPPCPCLCPSRSCPAPGHKPHPSVSRSSWLWPRGR